MAGRIVPTVTNVTVCAVLLALTLATTLLSRVDLGPFHFLAALAIAGAKAVLIALYFMHLRWTGGPARLAALGGLLWLGLLLAGTMDDYLTRAWLAPPGK